LSGFLGGFGGFAAGSSALAGWRALGKNRFGDGANSKTAACAPR
jgi:hypothetical protein